MGEEPQTLEEAKQDADVLESKRRRNLHLFKSQLFSLRKQDHDKRHEVALDNERKIVDAMTDLPAILREMERRHFQFPAGQVRNAIKEDAETLKFIADKRAGKHL